MRGCDYRRRDRAGDEFYLLNGRKQEKEIEKWRRGTEEAYGKENGGEGREGEKRKR